MAGSTGKPIELHPEALAEVEAAVIWYRERSLRAAEALVTEIDSAIESISEAPARWPAFFGNVRRFPLRRFPFWIIYKEEEKAIRLIAVAHVRRRHGYWKTRE